MYARAKVVLISLLVLLLSGSIVLAQVYAPAPGRPAFAQQELDQMLAPIALYPDALLSQILMAATYPVEIVEAARWSRRNPGLDGDRAVRAVERMDWDPSVKSLVAFPQILTLMDEKLDWTERLGDAFYAQQADVMDSVQYLRQKAYLAGNLRSSEQLRVDRQGQAIVIELANPEVIYVPYYNPTVVYGTWWWPAYQPIHWASWPGYYVRPGFARGYAWGPGIQVSRNFFFGATDWQRRSVQIVNVTNYYYNPPHVRAQADSTRSASTVWRHKPAEYWNVPHRDASLRQPSGVSPQPVVATLGARSNPERAPVASAAPAPQSSGNVVAPIAAKSAAAPQPAVSTPVAQANPRQVAANPGTRLTPERAPGNPNMLAVASQPGTRGGAHHQAAAPAASAAPALAPPGNAAAPAPTNSATASPPAGNPRARHQQ